MTADVTTIRDALNTIEKLANACRDNAIDNRGRVIDLAKAQQFEEIAVLAGNAFPLLDRLAACEQEMLERAAQAKPQLVTWLNPQWKRGFEAGVDAMSDCIRALSTEPAAPDPASDVTKALARLFSDLYTKRFEKSEFMLDAGLVTRTDGGMFFLTGLGRAALRLAEERNERKQA
jgi:hypothetical protein